MPRSKRSLVLWITSVGVAAGISMLALQWPPNPGMADRASAQAQPAAPGTGTPRRTPLPPAEVASTPAASSAQAEVHRRFLDLAHRDIRQLIFQPPRVLWSADASLRATWAQALLEIYLDGHQGSPLARPIIDTIHSFNLAPTARNLEQALHLSDSAPTDSERAAWLRQVGSWYPPSLAFEARMRIAEHLRKALQQPQMDERTRVAAREYGRIGYFDDSLHLLSRAHELGLMETSTYASTMAGLILEAPPEDQLTLLRIVADSGDEVGLGLLAAQFRQPMHLQNLSPTFLEQASKLLQERSPPWTMGHGDFGTVAYLDGPNQLDHRHHRARSHT